MKKTILASLVAAAVVGACGGGDDHQPVPPTSQVPPGASQSVDGFISYLKLLVATDPAVTAMLEPVDTSSVTAPTDDTIEPQVVD